MVTAGRDEGTHVNAEVLKSFSVVKICSGILLQLCCVVRWKGGVS